MSRKEEVAPAKWIENFSNSLFGYAIVRVSDREIAKDLVQETFLSALQNLSSFRGESSEKTWLFSILKNKIIDHYRKQVSSKTIPFSEFDNPVELEPYFAENGGWRDSERPTDWTENRHDDFRSHEFNEALQKCLSKLTAQCRAVFSLKYIDELESEDICKELTISPSNYWVIMHRAKLMLRRCIEENWIRR